MSKFQGTWRLERYEYRRADGQIYFPLGEDPKGLLIYTADGHMSGQIMRPERAMFAGGTLPSGTDAEIREAMLGYIAYFAEYSVDEIAQTVTHKVLASWTQILSSRTSFASTSLKDRTGCCYEPRRASLALKNEPVCWSGGESCNRRDSPINTESV